MSKSLVPRTDAGSTFIREVKHDGMTVAVTIGTVVAYSVLPIFAWVAPVVGGGYLLIRALKRSIGKSKR
ncbi:MAG: hypothetical protein AAB554_04755 [Patescibacteria group bacterium]